MLLRVLEATEIRFLHLNYLSMFLEPTANRLTEAGNREKLRPVLWRALSTYHGAVLSACSASKVEKLLYKESILHLYIWKFINAQQRELSVVEEPGIQGFVAFLLFVF